METEANDPDDLVNYDNDNDIDNLGYESEVYLDEEDEDDENTFQMGMILGKHRALFSSFLGELVSEHIGLKIYPGRRWVQKQEINYGMKSSDILMLT
ncbi:hypothetical protein Tco_1349976 [Tanacetum coccineum]